MEPTSPPPSQPSDPDEQEVLLEALAGLLVRAAEQSDREQAEMYLYSAEQAGLSRQAVLHLARQRRPNDPLLQSLT